MQLNEIHNPAEHASVSLKVILLVFAVLLVGVLGYLVWDFKNTPDTTDYSSTPTVTKTDDSTATETDETVDWETYENTTLGVSFKYPKEWGRAEEENIKTGDGPVAYDHLYISFDPFRDYPDSGYTYVSISTYNDINTNNQKNSDSENSYEGYYKKRGGGAGSDYLVDLRKIFTDNTVSSYNFPIWIPAINAGINWHSKIFFDSNSNSSWRGVYYYANVSQDSCSFSINNTATLTDNINLVVQFTSFSPSLKGAELLKTAKFGGAETDPNCKEFRTFTESLPSGGDDEPAVKNYSEVVSLMINSIKTL